MVTEQELALIRERVQVVMESVKKGVKMDVEILLWKDDIKKNRVGQVDFKVNYDEYKWEIFRGAAVFKKGSNLWIGLGAVQREVLEEDGRKEKWLSKFERSTGFKEIFEEVTKLLKKRGI